MRKICLLCTLSLIFAVSGCGAKTTTTVCTTSTDPLATTTFVSEGDKVQSAVIETSIDYSITGYTEEELSDLFDEDIADYIYDGFTYTYRFDGDIVTIKQTFDMNQLSIADLYELGMIEDENITSVSLKLSTDGMEDAGATCVTK